MLKNTYFISPGLGLELEILWIRCRSQGPLRVSPTNKHRINYSNEEYVIIINNILYDIC